MAEPFLGEIRMFSFAFAPKGWALCDGRLLPINQNQALFALLGVTYGGNGTTNFGLPDLRGRVPVHFGSGVVQGEMAGREAVVLSASQLPAHSHPVRASSDVANASSAAGAVLAGKPRGGVDVYANPSNLEPLAAGSVGNTGSSQAHPNMQPSLVMNFCIALQGIFPSPN